MLLNFVKNECANYYKDSCLFRDGCLIQKGSRCKYFEQSVLGPPDYPHKLPQYDYQKLFDEYSKITGTRQETTQKKCNICGKNIEKRKRLCTNCKRKQRVVTYRENQRNKRKQLREGKSEVSTTVIEK